MQPKNVVEEALLKLINDEISLDIFMSFIIKNQLFMPVEDDQKIAGFQASTLAKPLIIKTEDDLDVLILFSSPERAKVFLADYATYKGGILADFSWILAKVGYDLGISINPTHELGVDFAPEMVTSLKKICIVN